MKRIKPANDFVVLKDIELTGVKFLERINITLEAVNWSRNGNWNNFKEKNIKYLVF